MSLLKIAPEKMQSTPLSEDWKVRVRRSKEGLCKVHVTKPQILPNTQLYNREEKKRAGGEVEVALFPAHSMETACFQTLRREHRDAERCTPGTVLLPSSLHAPTRVPSPANHRHW